jgi:hypothetical protein
LEVTLRTFDQRRSLCPRRLREIPKQVGRRQANTEKWNHKEMNTMNRESSQELQKFRGRTANTFWAENDYE